jgi:hypothetical protein
VVDFSLYHNVVRNYRRAMWSSSAPTIYYPRWIQDTMQVFIFRPTVSTDVEILVDAVQLVHTGDGRPYPVFPSSVVQPVGGGGEIDFSKEGAMKVTFTASHLYRAANPPANLSLDDADGTKSWKTVIQVRCLSVAHEHAHRYFLVRLAALRRQCLFSCTHASTMCL